MNVNLIPKLLRFVKMCLLASSLFILSILGKLIEPMQAQPFESSTVQKDSLSTNQESVNSFYAAVDIDATETKENVTCLCKQYDVTYNTFCNWVQIFASDTLKYAFFHNYKNEIWKLAIHDFGQPNEEIKSMFRTELQAYLTKKFNRSITLYRINSILDELHEIQNAIKSLKLTPKQIKYVIKRIEQD